MPELSEAKPEPKLEDLHPWHQEFIARWNAAKDLREIAAWAQATHRNVSARASKLRKRGFALKVFPFNPIDRRIRIKSRIAAEDFVRAFNTSSSVKEAAKKLGITHEQCTNRASKLRSMGIPVRRMEPPNLRTARLIRTGALAKLARKTDTTHKIYAEAPPEWRATEKQLRSEIHRLNGLVNGLAGGLRGLQADLESVRQMVRGRTP